PSVWICVGVVLLVPLSPLLIFGLGPVPALGIAGAGAAVVATTALTALALGWYIAAGRSVAHFRWARLRWASFADILRVGAVASISTFQTGLAVLLTTGLVGGGWLAFWLVGTVDAIFAALAAALVTYGVMLSAAVASGVWFWRPLGAVFASGIFARRGLAR